MEPRRDTHGGNGNPKHSAREVAYSVAIVLAGLLSIWVLQRFTLASTLRDSHEIPYSEFRSKVKAGQVE